MALGAKNKLGFIDGNITKPSSDSEDLSKWIRNDYMIKKEVTGLLQNEMSVSEYYGKLKKYWDELNSLDGFPVCECGTMEKCSCKVMKKIAERESKGKVIDFLMGLNPKYDNTRGNILGMDPLPTVNKAFQILLQIEKQKEVTEGNDNAAEASALAVTKQNAGNKLTAAQKD